MPRFQCTCCRQRAAGTVVSNGIHKYSDNSGPRTQGISRLRIVGERPPRGLSRYLTPLCTCIHVYRFTSVLRRSSSTASCVRSAPQLFRQHTHSTSPRRVGKVGPTFYVGRRCENAEYRAQRDAEIEMQERGIKRKTRNDDDACCRSAAQATDQHHRSLPRTNITDTDTPATEPQTVPSRNTYLYRL